MRRRLSSEKHRKSKGKIWGNTIQTLFLPSTTWLCKQKLTGNQHPSTSTYINDMAVLLKAQEYYDDAELLFTDAMAVIRQVLVNRCTQEASLGINIMATPEKI